MKTLLMIFMLVGCAAAQTFDVELDVQSANPSLNSTMESHLSRELRSLGDVRVVNSNAFYTIHILAMESKTVSGYASGYSVAFVTTWNTPCTLHANNSSRTCRLFDDFHTFETGPNGLKSMCEEIIAAFDATSLKPLRNLPKKKQPEIVYN